MSESYYLMDAENNVLNRIKNAPNAFMSESLWELQDTNEEKYIKTASRLLLISNQIELVEDKRQSFTQGSAVTIECFKESDIEAINANRVRELFRLQLAPIYLYGRNQVEAEQAFRAEAGKGLKSHPELRKRIEHAGKAIDGANKQTLRYYFEVGAGFTAARFDRCYEEYLDELSEDKFETRIDKIDWDEQFETYF